MNDPTNQDIMNKLNEISGLITTESTTIVESNKPNIFTRTMQKYWYLLLSGGLIVGFVTHKWGVLKYLFSVFA